MTELCLESLLTCPVCGHAEKSYRTTLPGVIEVHDLHVWAMSTSETALTVHLVIAISTGRCNTLESA